MNNSNSSVINVKINENNEIEYLEADETNEEEGEYEDGQYQDIDDDRVLVATKTGVMTIKMKNKTVYEHVCSKCNKSYVSIAALMRHLNLCNNLPKFNTTKKENDSLMVLSEKEMKNITANIICFCCLEEVSTAHTGHIQCNFCPKSFKSHINLERHLFTLHSANTKFNCNSCNATCPSEEILTLHLKSHTTGKPFSCGNCGQGFTRKYHLERHRLYTGCDKTKPKLKLSCKVCNKIFTRTDNLREHLRAHLGQPTKRKDYQCGYCDKFFSGSSLLTIHLRTHTGEKPFPCDLCIKAFPSNGALRKHRRMHTGERPYSCKICEKRFSAKETLNRHMKLHTGERPHICNVCGLSFIQASQLRSHMLNHIDKTFQCDKCDAGFSTKSCLTMHLKAGHNNSNILQSKTDDFLSKESNDFFCDFCKQRFINETSLIRHQETHLKDESSTCKFCKEVFTRLSDLREHVKVEHRDKLMSIVAETKYKKTEFENTVVNTDSRNSLILKKSANTIAKEYEIVELGVYELVKDEYINPSTSDFTTNLQITKEEPVFKTEDKIHDSELSNPMKEYELNDNIRQLLKLLIEENILVNFGWPETPIGEVLKLVIHHCQHIPIDEQSCPDNVTALRENVKILFTSILDDDSIKALLNNFSVDEVILQILKSAT